MNSKVKDLIQFLEQIAPPIYQESYDNAGLIVGDLEMEISGVVTCLDSTEAALEEAIAKGCNVVVAHHPIVFKGIKSITGKNYVERILLKAIKNNLAIYAIHTNLDNTHYNGVNAKIAAILGLEQTILLAPRNNQKKINIFTNSHNAQSIISALNDLGLTLVYQQATVNNQVKLTYRLPLHNEKIVKQQLEQFSPFIDYEIADVESATTNFGSGIVGKLPQAMPALAFLSYLKERMQLKCIRHTKLLNNPVQKIAICGGSGSFLLPMAMAKKADVFITADYKYHDFFDADNKIIIADIGHYESEQFTSSLLNDLISEKFINFATYTTTVSTNPVFYFT
jgi:dinuclear metal center YbgI/SA1388 family protein